MMFYALVLAAALDASPSASAAPAPVATPTASPVPQYSLDGAFALYSAHTNGVNKTGALDTTSGTDLVSRTELSDGVLTLTKNTGPIRFTITGGAYAFPTVGQALNPTTQQGANAYLYGFVPLYSVSYVPNTHLSVSAGQLASLLGQESAFTTQNINIQRGLMWAAETTVSRGVRVTYTNAKVFGDLGYDDGFYAGNRGRALDGLAGWSPASNTTWQFAFTLPGPNTPGNPTAAIANKREYDL
ncbi:MAG TPA: outer membrane beta-barrel protein, partial [Candidatus Baltobacteraceae bacterium]|nr:outer membrane beta-barrel protein [Candidatus Baltobacteraceae bacterium]